MALTPEGTPYIESTDLVANYPAASLSLANRVDLVGVLPFADSAARATAIPSPTDGQYSYLQDTNVTEFWNGSAWVAAGTAPGLVHVNTTTFTTQSSVSVNNCFTSTYENYQIKLNILGSTNQDVSLRLRLSGTDATGANYNRQRLSAISTTVAAAGVGGETSFANQIKTSTVSSAVDISIFRPAAALPTGLIVLDSSTDGTVSLIFTVSNHTLSTAYDGFTFYPSTGTITGTIRVYGYKNS